MKNIFCFALLAILLTAVSAAAESKVGTGLEVDDHKKLAFAVEYVNQEEPGIGLTKDEIIELVKLRTQSAEIPVIEEDGTSYALYVNVFVVRNGFNVTVKFNRPVTYSATDQNYTIRATVWNKSITGTGASRNSLLASLDKLLIEFLKEYIKVNQK